MSKEKQTKSNAKQAKSNAPLLIIAGVLVAAGLTAWYFVSQSKPTPPANASNTAAKTPAAAKTPSIPANAPKGAEPPNLAGSQNATVTLEEFADFQCGSCAAANPTMSEIKSIYGSRIRFIFRNFPLAIPAHDKSYDAAVAAEAAGLQSPNKFWEMQNLLFTNQKAWTASPTYKEIWKDYAKKIGLDIAKWEADQTGMVAKARVNADMDRGKVIGISGTPSLYINGVPVQFSDMTVANLKSLIDAELAKNSPQTPAANTAAPAENGNQNK